MTTHRPLHVVPLKLMTSEAEVLAAWKAGKDFRIADLSSPYDNKLVSSREIGYIKADNYDGVKIGFTTDYALIDFEEEEAKADDE